MLCLNLKLIGLFAHGATAKIELVSYGGTRSVLGHTSTSRTNNNSYRALAVIFDRASFIANFLPRPVGRIPTKSRKQKADVLCDPFSNSA